MTNFRRALIAVLIFFGVTAVSLMGARIGTAAVPNYFVDIAHTTTCTSDGWKVDYVAGSFGSTLPWKVKLSTLGWLPAVNTYQVNTIPYTISTGILPFSQASTPPQKIDVQWTDLVTASDTEGTVNRPAGCVAPPTTTTTTTTTTTPTTTTTTIPATTTTATTAPETTVVEVTTTVTDPPVVAVVAPETTTPTEFPVTGKGDGGLLLGGALIGGGAIALVAARRPKHA